jgi:phenylacetate-CoA ligase
LLLEPAATVDDTGWDLLSGRVAAELADSHEGLRFHVRRAATGELPRFELKAKRLTDLRPAV